MSNPTDSNGTAHHWIGGDWVSGPSTKAATNPATGQQIGSWFDADPAIAQQAIDVARAAFEQTSWRYDRELRAKVLWKIADALDARLEDLAQAITAENGKPLTQARFELSIAAPKLRYFAGMALTDTGTAASVYTGATSMLLKEPIGVAGIIVPWNSPGVLTIRSLAPALAAGCTAVVKMPGQTALVANLLAQVFASVPELPAGVINIFSGAGGSTARTLVASPDVPVISFTGSTAVGSAIMADAAPQLKKLSLELGGKTPMVIFADADLDAVIPTLVAAITTFAGQFCMTGSRILVDQAIAADVQQRLTAALQAVVVGPGTDESTELGPLIDEGAVDRLEKVLASAEEKGAQILLSGGRVEGPGAFFRPVLLGVSDLSSPLIQEELFGPIATFETFAGEDEAIKRSNATEYGLSASVWTRDGARALRVAQRIDAGTVWTNTWAQILDQFEEGGFKKSGVGRLNGPGGLAEFQEVKHVYQTTRL